MKAPRCMKHTKRHYQVNDCDQCKKERIAELEAEVEKLSRLLQCRQKDIEARFDVIHEAMVDEDWQMWTGHAMERAKKLLEGK